MTDLDLTAVANAVLDVDGVAGLHGGLHGTIATYLPGRRLSGLRVDDEQAHVHLALFEGHDLGAVAESVRRVVADRLGRDSQSVVIIVEDLVPLPTSD